MKKLFKLWLMAIMGVFAATGLTFALVSGPMSAKNGAKTVTPAIANHTPIAEGDYQGVLDTYYLGDKTVESQLWMAMALDVTSENLEGDNPDSVNVMLTKKGATAAEDVTTDVTFAGLFYGENNQYIWGGTYAAMGTAMNEEDETEYDSYDFTAGSYTITFSLLKGTATGYEEYEPAVSKSFDFEIKAGKRPIDTVLLVESSVNGKVDSVLYSNLSAAEPYVYTTKTPAFTMIVKGTDLVLGTNCQVKVILGDDNEKGFIEEDAQDGTFTYTCPELKDGDTTIHFQLYTKPSTGEAEAIETEEGTVGVSLKIRIQTAATAAKADFTIADVETSNGINNFAAADATPTFNYTLVNLEGVVFGEAEGNAVMNIKWQKDGANKDTNVSAASFTVPATWGLQAGTSYNFDFQLRKWQMTTEIPAVGEETDPNYQPAVPAHLAAEAWDAENTNLTKVIVVTVAGSQPAVVLDTPKNVVATIIPAAGEDPVRIRVEWENADNTQAYEIHFQPGQNTTGLTPYSFKINEDIATTTSGKTSYEFPIPLELTPGEYYVGVSAIQLTGTHPNREVVAYTETIYTATTITVPGTVTPEIPDVIKPEIVFVKPVAISENGLNAPAYPENGNFEVKVMDTTIGVGKALLEVTVAPVMKNAADSAAEEANPATKVDTISVLTYKYDTLTGRHGLYTITFRLFNADTTPWIDTIYTELKFKDVSGEDSIVIEKTTASIYAATYFRVGAAPVETVTLAFGEQLDEGTSVLKHDIETEDYTFNFILNGATVGQDAWIAYEVKKQGSLVKKDTMKEALPAQVETYSASFLLSGLTDGQYEVSYELLKLTVEGENVTVAQWKNAEDVAIAGSFTFVVAIPNDHWTLVPYEGEEITYIQETLPYEGFPTTLTEDEISSKFIFAVERRNQTAPEGGVEGHRALLSDPNEEEASGALFKVEARIVAKADTTKVLTTALEVEGDDLVTVITNSEFDKEIAKGEYVIYFYLKERQDDNSYDFYNKVDGKEVYELRHEFKVTEDEPQPAEPVSISLFNPGFTITGNTKPSVYYKDGKGNEGTGIVFNVVVNGLRVSEGDTLGKQYAVKAVYVADTANAEPVTKMITTQEELTFRMDSLADGIYHVTFSLMMPDDDEGNPWTPYMTGKNPVDEDGDPMNIEDIDFYIAVGVMPLPTSLSASVNGTFAELSWSGEKDMAYELNIAGKDAEYTVYCNANTAQTSYVANRFTFCSGELDADTYTWKVRTIRYAGQDPQDVDLTSGVVLTDSSAWVVAEKTFVAKADSSTFAWGSYYDAPAVQIGSSRDFYLNIGNKSVRIGNAPGNANIVFEAVNENGAAVRDTLTSISSWRDRTNYLYSPDQDFEAAGKWYVEAKMMLVGCDGDLYDIFPGSKPARDTFSVITYKVYPENTPIACYSQEEIDSVKFLVELEGATYSTDSGAGYFVRVKYSCNQRSDTTFYDTIATKAGLIAYKVRSDWRDIIVYDSAKAATGDTVLTLGFELVKAGVAKAATTLSKTLKLYPAVPTIKWNENQWFKISDYYRNDNADHYVSFSGAELGKLKNNRVVIRTLKNNDKNQVVACDTITATYNLRWDCGKQVCKHYDEEYDYCDEYGYEYYPAGNYTLDYKVYKVEGYNDIAQAVICGEEVLTSLTHNFRLLEADSIANLAVSAPKILGLGSPYYFYNQDPVIKFAFNKEVELGNQNGNYLVKATIATYKLKSKGATYWDDDIYSVKSAEQWINTTAGLTANFAGIDDKMVAGEDGPAMGVDTAAYYLRMTVYQVIGTDTVDVTGEYPVNCVFATATGKPVIKFIADESYYGTDFAYDEATNTVTFEALPKYEDEMLFDYRNITEVVNGTYGEEINNVMAYYFVTNAAGDTLNKALMMGPACGDDYDLAEFDLSGIDRDGVYTLTVIPALITDAHLETDDYWGYDMFIVDEYQLVDTSYSVTISVGEGANSLTPQKFDIKGYEMEGEDGLNIYATFAKPEDIKISGFEIMLNGQPADFSNYQYEVNVLDAAKMKKQGNNSKQAVDLYWDKMKDMFDEMLEEEDITLAQYNQYKELYANTWYYELTKADSVWRPDLTSGFEFRPGKMYLGYISLVKKDVTFEDAYAFVTDHDGDEEDIYHMAGYGYDREPIMVPFLFKMDAAPAVKPTYLDAQVTEDTVVFIWNVEPEHNYEIQVTSADTVTLQGVVTAKTGSIIWQGNTGFYGVYSIFKDGDYTWRIRGVKVDNRTILDSTDWAEGNAFTVGKEPVEDPVAVAPTNLARTVDGQNVTFTWTAAEGAAYQIMVMKGNEQVAFELAENGTHTIEGLEAGNYTWKMRGVAFSADVNNRAMVDSTAWVDGPAFTIEEETTANVAEKLANVNIYPNPTAGQFTVNVPVKANVEIFGTNGTVVERRANVDGKVVFNLNHSGIYFVRIATADQAVVKRVIVR